MTRRPITDAQSKQAAATKRAAELFGRKNRDPLPPLPEMRDGTMRVVERVLDLDIEEAYARLEGQLTIDDALTPQAVRVALNRADANAELASRMYATAKVEFDAWEFESTKVEAAMRRAAIEDLGLAKEMGMHRKQITEGDVAARCAALYPDEYVAIVTRRSRAKTTLEHLKKLVEFWQSRCRTLTSLNNN